MNRDCIERTVRRDALPTCQLYSAVIRYPGPVTGGQNDRISSCRSIDASARVHRTRGNTSYANTTYRMLYGTWIDVHVHTQSHAYTRMRTGSRTNSTDSLMDDTFVSSLRVHIARIIYARSRAPKRARKKFDRVRQIFSDESVPCCFFTCKNIVKCYYGSC